jgi:hypothetical protein
MDAIATVSYLLKPGDKREISLYTKSIARMHHNGDFDDSYNLKLCSKLLKRLLRTMNNSSVLGLDRIGWQERIIWFLSDQNGLCDLIIDLMRTSFPAELELGVLLLFPSIDDGIIPVSSTIDSS